MMLTTANLLHLQFSDKSVKYLLSVACPAPSTCWPLSKAEISRRKMPLFPEELVVSQKINRDARITKKSERTAKTKAFDCVTGVLW